MQESIGAGLNLCMTGMLQRLKRILSEKQRPNCDDYLVAGMGSTKTCNRICDTLAKQFEFVTGKLQGKVQHNFVRSFVSKLYKILVEHLTTLKFSVEATIEIKSDFKNYTSTIMHRVPDNPQNADIQAKIEVMNDLATIFLVDYKYVKDVIRESRMAILNQEVLKKFVSCRSDYEERKEMFDQMFK